MSFDTNIYDGHTLPDELEQCWTITETVRSWRSATSSHLKHDFRPVRSYLKGAVGDACILFMALQRSASGSECACSEDYLRS